jgi:NAD(P)-dependent dehydrogenase (short-subunit alcohol dehydrogenase family)
MKIVITGTQGLGSALADRFCEHTVVGVSRSNGHDIAHVRDWGSDFLDHDMIINCAYSGFDQVTVLEYFYQHWQNDSSKHIINIGSKIIDHPRSERDKDHDYWPYRLHKQTLYMAWKNMVESNCDVKLINPGAIDTSMMRNVNNVKKFDPAQLADKCYQAIMDPTVKRLDLWL